MQHARAWNRPDGAFRRPETLEVRGVPAYVGFDHIERNRIAWEKWAAGHAPDARHAWQTDQLRWGVWDTPESELGLLTGFEPADDAIELGSGTCALSAWLARLELRPVAVDIAQAQLRAAESLQKEFQIDFPLVCANAEKVPFDDESFDLAISEYGASLWCDPRRWLAEAYRLLRPEGRLVFITSSPLLMTCTPFDGGVAVNRLVRDHFSRYRVEFDTAVEFHLAHGDWIRMLRAIGFEIDDLIEVQPDADSVPRFGLATSEWAQRWPSEDIWVVHKSE